MAAIWMSVSLGFLPAFGFGTLRNVKEELKSLHEVFVGDVIVLRTGDMVPVDC